MPKRSAARVVRDVGALKALAHPLRMRLIHALSASGEATVSELARAVGASPALVSYHVRQLAQHGFVQEASTRSDGREHAYRRTPGGISWATSDFARLPAGREVAATATRVNFGQQLARFEAWNDKRDEWGSDWADASLMTDTMLHLTPAELGELSAELLAVIERYRVAGAKRSRRRPADSDREAVFAFAHAFPTQP
ncbi:MAG: metalloregulator ArsR/SmtB family transcription factor [Actinomycetota bacterium]